MAPYSSPPSPPRRSRSSAPSHTRRRSIQRHHDPLPLPRTSYSGINPPRKSTSQRPGTAQGPMMTEAEFRQLPESIQYVRQFYLIHCTLKALAGFHLLHAQHLVMPCNRVCRRCGLVACNMALVKHRATEQPCCKWEENTRTYKRCGDQRASAVGYQGPGEHESGSRMRCFLTVPEASQQRARIQAL
jgi:hypothetical protein